MPSIAALIAGILFGIGLTVSQMTNPAKVLDFLDIAAIRSGTWDPTLLMVFAGALPTMFLGYCLKNCMQRPLIARAFLVPTPSPIDGRLIAGSAIFGVGWGLAGVCPGPAIASLAPTAGQLLNVALFCAAMIAGVMLSWLFARPPHLRPPATQART